MIRPVRGTAAGRAYLDLQNRARREKRGTQELLTMYVVERWLARLSRSAYAEDFVLKGGMLLASFGHRRPTVDADALARNMSSDRQFVARRVAEIAVHPRPNTGAAGAPAAGRYGAAMAKGTLSRRASVWARNVLPEPVGPSRRMFDLATSTSSWTVWWPNWIRL